MRDLIIIALVILTFYKHGTKSNFWYKLGKWSRKLKEQGENDE